jgi:hypothetical protein
MRDGAPLVHRIFDQSGPAEAFETLLFLPDLIIHKMPM